MSITDLNYGVTQARLQYENNLRLIIERSSTLLAPDFNDDEETILASSWYLFEDEGFLSPVERVAANISAVVRRGQRAISLAAARGLATRRANSWYNRHKHRLDLYAAHAGSEAARVIQSLMKNKRIKKIEKDDRLAYELGRSIESMGSGGKATFDAAGNVTGQKPVTLLDDEDFATMIREEGNASPVYYWEHGSPREPFAPHKALNGVTWVAEDELQVLANPNPFPVPLSYYPGDHNGCTCRYDIQFQRIN